MGERGQRSGEVSRGRRKLEAHVDGGALLEAMGELEGMQPFELPGALHAAGGSKVARLGGGGQRAHGALVGVPVKSYLGTEADVHRVRPDAPEACCYVPKRRRI